MKSSGVEWIGEIPEEWEVSKIGQLYEERRTKVSDTVYPPLSVTMQGILPQLETAAKSDAHDDRKLVLKGDFAINSRSDRRGSCGISEHDGSVSLINTVLHPKTEMNPIYYNWLFHSFRFSDEYYKNGHGIVDDLWTTSWSEMKRIFIPLPPKSIQQHIASYLDKKCSKIEETIQNQQQVIEKLKTYKQSLITESVTGKIKIQNGKVCGKYENYKDSGVEWIGKIPSEWEVGKTGMFTYVTKLAGFEFTDIMMDKISENGDVPIVRAQNVRMFKFNKEIINEYIDLSTSNTLNRCCLDKKCLLITFIGAGIGDICIFDESIRYHLAPNVAKIEIRNFTKTKLCEEFLMYYIGSEPGKREIANISKVAAQPSLSMETIRKIKLCIPPFEEQKLIVDYLYPKCLSIDKTIEQKQELIVKLTEYKKSLIYECVTGKKESNKCMNVNQ